MTAAFTVVRAATPPPVHCGTTARWPQRHTAHAKETRGAARAETAHHHRHKPLPFDAQGGLRSTLPAYNIWSAPLGAAGMPVERGTKWLCNLWVWDPALKGSLWDDEKEL